MLLTIGGREIVIAFKRRWLAQILDDITRRLKSRDQGFPTEPFTVFLDLEEIAIYRSFLKKKMVKLGTRSLKKDSRTKKAALEHFYRIVQWHCEGYWGMRIERNGNTFETVINPPPCQ